MKMEAMRPYANPLFVLCRRLLQVLTVGQPCVSGTLQGMQGRPSADRRYRRVSLYFYVFVIIKLSPELSPYAQTWTRCSILSVIQLRLRTCA